MRTFPAFVVLLTIIMITSTGVFSGLVVAERGYPTAEGAYSTVGYLNPCPGNARMYDERELFYDHNLYFLVLYRCGSIVSA